MALTANYPGARLGSGRAPLEGSDRGLDALVGLVILVAEVLIGFLAISSLYLFGLEHASDPNAFEGVPVGFLVALIGGAGFVALTTLTYLMRVIRGRRSWTAPLWGAVLMTVSVVTGYFIMTSGITGG